MRLICLQIGGAGSDNVLSGSAPAPSASPPRPAAQLSPMLGGTKAPRARYEEVIGTNPSRFMGANLQLKTVYWDEAIRIFRTQERRDATRPRTRNRVPAPDSHP